MSSGHEDLQDDQGGPETEARVIQMAPVWIKAERWQQLWRSAIFGCFLLVIYWASQRYLELTGLISTGLEFLLIAAALLRLLLAWLLPRWLWRRCHYEIHDDRLLVYRGLWTRRIQTIPRSRIQHIELSQGPIDRRYDLSVLSLNTAGTVFARISLEGLPTATAKALRDEFVESSQDDR